jgi:hypothetical protein
MAKKYTADSVEATSFTGSLFGTSSWAGNATTAPLYLPLAGGTMTGDIYAAGRTFQFQDLVLGVGTTFGTIKTDGTKYIGIYPTNAVESTRFLANGNVIHGTNFTDAGYRLQVSASGAAAGALQIVGTSVITGSLNVTQGITGSLQGTASNALTASYYNGSITSASYAQTASVAPAYLPLTGGTLTGNLTAPTIIGQTSVTALSGSQFTMNNPANTTYYTIYTDSSNILNFGFGGPYPKATLSAVGNLTASGSITGTYIIKAGGTSTQYLMADGTVTTFPTSFTGSLQGTASYATQALSASWAPGGGSAFPYTGSAEITGSLGITGSLSQGTGNIASGQFSHAEGSSTLATGVGAHTEGLFTTASGAYSHAEGQTTQAKGYGAHAEGANTIASGSWSHAEGYQTVSIGDWSHAEGQATTASGSYSHAEGQLSGARGNYSHAEGLSTEAIGTHSHTEGQGTKTPGTYSHAEGTSTVASGYSSHAEGNQTSGSGNYSHAEGFGANASGEASHAEGYFTVAAGDYSHTEGRQTSASGAFGHAEGFDNNAIGEASHAEGRGSVSFGSAAHAEGYFTRAEGTGAHTEGYYTTASGVYSHAEGYTTRATGEASHAEGRNGIASGLYSHAEGGTTVASGLGSHAEGFETSASGDYSHAEGDNTIALGNASHAQGRGTISSGSYQTVVGQFNVTSSVEGAFIIGNGSISGTRSNLVFTTGSQFQVTGSVHVSSFIHLKPVSVSSIVGPTEGMIIASGSVGASVLYYYNGTSWNALF